MSLAIPLTIGALVITLTGAIAFLVYPRRDAAREARNQRVTEFFDSLERFRARILDPHRRHDYWVPYFKQKLPQLRKTFDKVASGLPREKRHQLNQQIVSLVAFFSLPPEEIYEREEEFKALVEQLNR